MRSKDILIIGGLIVAIVAGVMVFNKLKRKRMIDLLVDRLGLDAEQLTPKTNEDLAAMISSLNKQP